MTLLQAQKELALYLKENPHLIDYQLKINEYLNNAKTQEERFEVLLRHINDNIKQLEEEFTILSTLIK